MSATPLNNLGGTESLPLAAPPRSAGARCFEKRGWIHPILLSAALILGGARPGAMAAGGVLLVLYLVIRIWCCRFLGGAARVHARKAQERKVLVTGGPFGLVRNPLYLANTAGITGACLLTGPEWFGAVAAVVSLLWYALIVRWEESVLRELYPHEYATYRTLVPRFFPRLSRPAGLPAANTRGDYPWSKVLRRERGAIGLVFLIAVLALLRTTLH